MLANHAKSACSVVCVVVCVVFCAAILLFGTGCNREQVQAQLDPVTARHLDDAKFALGEGNWGMALAFADSVIAEAPEVVDAHFLRGQVLSQSNLLDEAGTAFQQVLAIDADYPSAWFNLGNIEYKKRAFNDALEKYEKEVGVQQRQREKFGKAYEVRFGEIMSRLSLQKGRAFRQSGEHDKAATAFREATDFDAANADAFADLSQLLREEGKSVEALTFAQKAISLAPGHPEYEYLVGAIKLELGKSQEAVPHLEKALESKPWFAPARYSYGQALLELGEQEEGELQLQAADTLQMMDKRIERARFNAQTYPNDHTRWLVLGQMFLQTGRFGEALEPFYIARSLQPGNLSIQNDIANISLIRGDTLGALRQLDGLLAANPAFADGWYNLGVIYALQKRYNEAASAWRKVLKLNPSHIEAKQNLEKLPTK